MGHPQNSDETTLTLDALADSLESCAEKLRAVSEKMKLAGIRDPISVRHGVAVQTAVRDNLRPFLADVEMKADRAIALAKKAPSMTAKKCVYFCAGFSAGAVVGMVLLPDDV